MDNLKKAKTVFYISGAFDIAACLTGIIISLCTANIAAAGWALSALIHAVVILVVYGNYLFDEEEYTETIKALHSRVKQLEKENIELDVENGRLKQKASKME